MENNKTFTITFTKQNGESVTRRGKWTEDCREFVAKAGHKVLTLDKWWQGYTLVWFIIIIQINLISEVRELK